MPWSLPERSRHFFTALAQWIKRAITWLLHWPWRLLKLIGKGLMKIPPIAALAQSVARRLQPMTHSVARHWHVWRGAWDAQNKQPPRAEAKGKELEFLPAVLEVQETPPSPASRAIISLIVGAFTAAIVWASFGKIDIVAVAQGKIIPSDYSKVIQPLEAGVIEAIHVQEGQYVNKGDALLDLDTTASGADHARFTNEHQAARLEIARLRALLDSKTEFDVPEGSDPKFALLQQRMLGDQLQEFQARLASSELVIQQRQAALEGAKVNVARLKATVPLLKQRVTAFKKLVDKQYVSKLQYLELKEEYINKANELAAALQQLQQDQAALAEARKNHQAVESEFKRSTQAQLSELETRSESLSNEVVKAESRTSSQRLTAPISGVVQQLAVHTIGGVVTPAQELMVIVPREGQLTVEAWVENKDIGFVNQDQIAEIKVEAFPFTRYGTIDGKIKTLSLEAIPLENVGYVYAAKVIMDRTTMQVENKTVNLSPGMNVTVEIKTGKRRLIEFFLSPLLRAAKESARER